MPTCRMLRIREDGQEGNVQNSIETILPIPGFMEKRLSLRASSGLLIGFYKKAFR